MVRHSVVAYRDDAPAAPRPIGFAGDAWLELRADPHAGHDRASRRTLPPGAAAVLINRNHTYTDIYLPIDAQEKRLFDAIDGTAHDRARSPRTRRALDVRARLFERLWWHDQVALRNVRARAPLHAALRRRRDSNPRRFRATVFKTVAFDHSATPPIANRGHHTRFAKFTTRRRARC